MCLQAGQVWFPDSALKTAAALEEFDLEGLPLVLLANWRGFSGGQRDLFEGVLQASVDGREGSCTVCAVCVCICLHTDCFLCTCCCCATSVSTCTILLRLLLWTAPTPPTLPSPFHTRAHHLLQAGSLIVEALRTYRQPAIIYLPPGCELRGGAWVVIDSQINSEMVEMYADPTARGGVLEPEVRSWGGGRHQLEGAPAPFPGLSLALTRTAAGHRSTQSPCPL